MTNSQNKTLRAFDRSLPMALLRAREAVMKKFIPSLRENGLSSQQWRVIRALNEEEGLDITELAHRCFLLMPSLSRIIQNLEKRKLVIRNQSSSDNRKSVISITAPGKKLFQKIAPKSVERYDLITEKFGYGKLELLYELLDELIEKIDEKD
ncbi:MAG: homoprotocatechuate degradation operon regulator HpaR [Gammaproteobacteria bacterium]|jgi:homoprotocatechuate degradation regulator HpaR|nr:homoprotocatechuate degradation operon regulator HpaR [Gammaproteobacteria bacterium]MBT3870680.1 homoprotocatechuate degradation operon regulator HpaR [Gammaproteobacteria bacterium]MBT4381348.1 homoprotocatechuate degradation operon regulator HpaR [Gammaproteobacteria bacterium]MBT4617804.1 homoprotocatechuate degradation operon regulator HpaR [Gammaproteobacteria bacterium]MBT5196711.1 homoprotocatechuate degradation operon regulator HpaR [Gammaproteobacteria bacterium]